MVGIYLIITSAATAATTTWELFTPKIMEGVYVGMGGSLNTIDENFNSTLITTTRKSGRDHYLTNQFRLAPLAQVGFSHCVFERWLWGVAVQWKYLGYKTINVNSTVGQHLPNASFSSINIFGPEVIRDFTSQTRLNHEVMLLLSAGMQLPNGSAYLGVGPALLTASNKVFVTSVHTPNGTGDHLVSTSVSRSKTLWGGSAQIGYNYFLAPSCFLNLNYTYTQSGKYHFNNSANTATLNGATIAGPTTLHLKRAIKFRAQEIMFSINKVLAI